ncbi:MAG: hypothetical protein ACLFV4_13870 [Candidatus Hydrogenedentota bacterium]
MKVTRYELRCFDGVVSLEESTLLDTTKNKGWANDWLRRILPDCDYRVIAYSEQGPMRRR